MSLLKGYIFFFITILAINFAFVSARIGVDLSSVASVETFKCLLSEKYDFVNMRAWHSYGGLDVNAATTI
jgi:hypothetical protein